MTTLLVSLLWGCGGGGGGASDGGNEPPPASQRENPLALTAANVGDSASLGLGYGSLGLALAQLAIDWTQAANDSTVPSSTRPCGAGGTATLNLTDADGNHRVSAGDRLTVSVSNCYLKPLEDTFTGSLTIDIVQPGAGQTLAGSIVLGSQFTSSSQGITARLAGGLLFDYTATRLAKSLHVASSGQAFRLIASSGTASATELITQLDATRASRRDTARVTTSMSYRLASDLLGGSLMVTTTSPWANWFNSYPDAGTLDVGGAAGHHAQLIASPSGELSFTVQWDGAAAGSAFAEDAATAYLWSGAGWIPADEDGAPYAIQTASSVGFKNLIAPSGASLPPNPGPLEWLYSRPLAPDALVTAAFVRSLVGPGDGWGPASIAATVQIEGALLTVTPSSQLEPGSSYSVMFDNSFSPIADTNGATTTRPALTIDVANTVIANAVIDGPPVLFAGQSLALDASSSSADGAVVSTHWRQVSGPALLFTSSETARTAVSVAGTSNGNAVVEVEVQNTAGDIDRKALTFAVGGDVSSFIAVGYRSGASPLQVFTNIDATFGYARYFAMNNVIDVIVPGARLLASPPTGQAWQSGIELLYPSGGANVVWLPTSGPCLNTGVTPTGHVAVLDFALDTSGALSRLSVDFEENCAGVTTSGSIRFGSVTPLRP